MPFVLFAILVAVPLFAWILRNTIATSLAASEARARGLACDERFSVELSAGLREATVGPTRCVHAGGLVEAIELTAPATIVLDGLEPASITAEGVRVTLRDRDLRSGSGWAPALGRLHLEQRVAGLIKGLSEMSGLGLPRTVVARAEVLRGADRLATVDGLELTPGAPTGVAIRRVSFPAVMGAAQLTLGGVTGTASRGAVHLEGEATARAGVSILGVSTGGDFELDASGLDTASPDLRLRASF